MPSYPIDVDRATMVATGKVLPVTEWTADGKRTDTPKRDPNTGAPVWLVDCLVDDDDATRAVVAGVEVPSIETPAPPKYSPVVFEGLTVDVYVKRATGALVARWSATGIKSSGGRASHTPAAQS